MSKRVVFGGIPRCTTPSQFKKWMEVARIIKPGRAGFCEDCTPEYAAKMRSCGMCEQPQIIFADGDGCVPTAHHIKKGSK